MPPTSSATRQPYLLAGEWELDGLLGVGEWARVYRARPANSPQQAPADYAIKIAHAPGSPHLAARLLQREAHISRTASHPHLISVLGARLHQPPYYLVTPYLQGASMREALDYHGALPVEHALWVTRQLAQALHALHRNGWSHADIKPNNVYVADTGHVTLLDLGLARKLKSPSRSEVWVGSPAYASPESFRSPPQYSEAGDIYSLGVLLFEMLTGTPPFSATHHAEWAEAHHHQTPASLELLAPNAGQREAKLLEEMLAKEPEKRPPAARLAAWLIELEMGGMHRRAA